MGRLPGAALERGGHDKLCRKIKKAGGAEQYNANKKYAEAVTVAAEACAEDTKGQTCYICTQALHWKTKEGLVRGCACRGTAGFAHVSCLAEQAKILVDEVEENNLDWKAMMRGGQRWYMCSLCEQRYHGVVFVRARVGVLEDLLGSARGGPCSAMAMSQLGNGLSAAEQFRGRVVRARGRVVYAAAIGDQMAPFSACRAILRERIEHLDG